jgi:hypothetical protein
VRATPGGRVSSSGGRLAPPRVQNALLARFQPPPCASRARLPPLAAAGIALYVALEGVQWMGRVGPAFEPVHRLGTGATAQTHDQIEHAGDGDAERAVVAKAQLAPGGKRPVRFAEQVEGSRPDRAGEVRGTEIAPRAGARLRQFSRQSHRSACRGDCLAGGHLAARTSVGRKAG